MRSEETSFVCVCVDVHATRWWKALGLKASVLGYCRVPGLHLHEALGF